MECKDIHRICKDCDITKYDINTDGSIDVYGGSPKSVGGIFWCVLIQFMIN